MNYFSFKGFVLGGAVLTVLGFILYTAHLQKQLKKEATTLSRIYARYCASAAYPAREGVELQIIFEEVIQRINFPVVFTDPTGRPLIWRNLGDEIGENSSPSPELIKRLDRQNQPITMTTNPGSKVIGILHYGDSPVIRQLRYLPYIELLAVALFFLVAFYGYRSLKRTEESYIWIGMARETAHQLGTPISSLMGWLELLKDALGELEGRPKEVIEEMSRDVSRLSKIASRFSKIGSRPDMELVDLDGLLRDTIEYFRPRIPRFARSVDFREVYGDVGKVLANREVLEWAFENLVKNALEALRDSSGVIAVETRVIDGGKSAEVLISDSGSGIQAGDQRRVFQPGFTTKKRGWGLGLALAKRIIENYHNGHIRLKSSEQGVGTTFQVILPRVRDEA